MRIDSLFTDAHPIHIDLMNRSALRKLEDDIACAIRCDARVMITGERGSGKKFVARAIHERSHRGAAPFVVATHEDLTDSAREAQNGTLLVDAIDDVGDAMQLQLMELIENGMTGGSPRLMTTTTPDMLERVRSGKFPAALYYRLNTMVFVIPALREHPQEIPTLLEHYLSSYERTNTPRLSPVTLRRLVQYRWPGNIQELKALTAALALKDLARLIEPEDLLPSLC